MLSYYLVYSVWEAELYCLILSRIIENNHSHLYLFISAFCILHSKFPHPFYIPHDCPPSNAVSESVVQELTDGTLEIYAITAYIYGKL